MLNEIQRWHYSGVMTASHPYGTVMISRGIPEDVLRRWRENLHCAACEQKIAAGLTPTVIGSQAFHPSCGARARAAARPATTTRAADAPSIIGTICGVALPFNERCFISNERGVERFAPTAFDVSIARGGQSIQIDHDNAPIPGDLTLFAGPDLRFRLKVHDTPRGRHALDLVDRGLIRGVSVRFKPLRERAAERNVVQVDVADLREISLCHCNRPAWFATQAWRER